jgi:hypothetical protein
MGGVRLMLLGGKGGCQQCACVPTPCQECRHYTIDTYYLTAAVTTTINGSNVPVWDGTTPAIPNTFLELTPNGAVQSTCFDFADSPKKVRFYVWYEPLEFSEEYDNNGCPTWRAYAWIIAKLYDSTYFENGARSIPTYVLGNCDDVGGTGTSPSWEPYNNTSVPEDCEIEWLDWLNGLTIVTTFAWDACECPP